LGVRRTRGRTIGSSHPLAAGKYVPFLFVLAMLRTQIRHEVVPLPSRKERVGEKLDRRRRTNSDGKTTTCAGGHKVPPRIHLVVEVHDFLRLLSSFVTSLMQLPAHVPRSGGRSYDGERVGPGAHYAAPGPIPAPYQPVTSQQSQLSRLTPPFGCPRTSKIRDAHRIQNLWAAPSEIRDLGARRCRGAGLSWTEPRPPARFARRVSGPPGVHPWREKNALVH
jgi:hypothetical protein